jgi:hypothetical protein
MPANEGPQIVAAWPLLAHDKLDPTEFVCVCVGPGQRPGKNFRAQLVKTYLRVSKVQSVMQCSPTTSLEPSYYQGVTYPII